MDKTLWLKIREIFTHLSEESPSFRSNYLDMVCSHDPELRSKVEGMLASHDELVASEAQLQQAEHEFNQHQVGTRLGDYEIVSVIGTGSMSVIYQATHPQLGDVAIKSLPSCFNDVPEARARLEQEANILASLTHPSMCHVHEFLQTLDQFAIVMELVEGKSLDEAITCDPPSFSQSLDIAIELASVLSLAHANGVVHRDIKPSNVLITADYKTKLIDFGIAHFDKARLTYTGEMLGSPAYMAPEQWTGQSVNGRTDIWALGALLYFMCCKQSAFHGSSIIEYAREICNARPREWSSNLIKSKQMLRVQQLVMIMLSKRPEDRPESITTVLHELELIKLSGG